ncbi:MAG: S-layer glycoprotein N-glycosyltransferase AglJ [Candidatus Aenigmatarchaeota archaeon]|nr:S-layer glycoprotein N-glycosyltransferase AglJ [Candidatus Aenigmarchaeota archaeon]
MNKDNVTIIIPTLNEEKGIGDVIDSFKENGFKNILVIDGHSTDKTRDIAASRGAKVILQSGKGKGKAVIEAIDKVETEYCILVDADKTYDANEADKLLAELEKGYDQVIGNRLLEKNKKSFTRFNFFGNKLINNFFAFVYGICLKDICTGYRAFKTKSLRELFLKESGFGIETEISVEAVKNNQKIAVVDISYYKREGKTKLNPISDGFRIITLIIRLARYQNPLLFFGAFGIFFTLIGILLGIYIVYDWFLGISHSLLVTLDAIIITVGIMFFLAGLLGSIIINTKRDIIRQIKNLSENK